MSTAQATAGPSASQRFYSGMQKMGRSLQLPVAGLPAAGILNRLGQDDVFGRTGLGWDNVAKVCAAAGGGLLNAYIGLPLLFCIGVALGMAKKADGPPPLWPWRTAPSRVGARRVTGMMISLGLTSLVTGVTEPIEFSFCYIARALYVLHALLTGCSMAITWALGVHDGFSFSAGLTDYLINANLATKPLVILPVGAVFAVVYYAVFRFAITRFDLKTPGREDDADEPQDSITT